VIVPRCREFGREAVGNILTAIRRFLSREEEAASVAEYAVALMLIGIVTLVAVSLLGSAISTFIANAARTI
jgi:Flp pilus assembly pilin Flp